MTIAAIAVVLIWILALVDMASESDSWWTRTIDAARKRAREWSE